MQQDANMEDSDASLLGLESPSKALLLRLPDTASLRRELEEAFQSLSFCELASSAQWAAELCAALPEEADTREPAPGGSSSSAPFGFRGAGSVKVRTAMMLAKSHFGMREFSRAAHALLGVDEPSAVFLRLYALYLAGEKRREEESLEAADPVEKCQVRNVELKAIEEKLAALHSRGLLDGLSLYLYGITLRGLDLKVEARVILFESVRKFPCNWSAWLDIMSLSSDLNDMSDLQKKDLQLPNHWMSCFFQAALDLELQRNDEALDMYVELRRHKFPGSSYILSQIATCHYNVRNFDASHSVFDELRKRDPYKLATLDTYSNILYVKEQAAALSHLARHAVKIDKYTPEACCIIGNYYSLKGEHEKSVVYFQRALCLNRNFTPALILMGHEFMEMKNTAAAIEAYRNAVNINQRDYRAWYGLGQTYELLNLHFYALFYYRRAMTLRPNDARMWCAMAQCYELMDRKAEALKCYEKAHRCGDRERMALPRLARLHRDLGDRRQAAAYYGQMFAQHGQADAPKSLGGGLSTEVVEALKFLMVYYREEGRLNESETCATRLLDTAGPEKDEAKALLRDLRNSVGMQGLFFAGGGP